MAGTATIIGGGVVNLSLDPAEYAAAQNALTNIGGGYTQGAVETSLSMTPQANTLNIYNLPDPAGDIYNLPAGAQGIVVDGSDNVSITGLAQREVLIGNMGNDVINAAGGSGTVIAGDGNNFITTGEASVASTTVPSLSILVGSGDNTIVLSQGADTVNMLPNGSDTIDIEGNVASASISGSGTGSALVLDNSTAPGGSSITVSGGNDTVVATGSATVYGGPGQLYFQGGAGSDSVSVGSGDSTLIGGSGNDTFAAGSGHTMMYAGSGNDTFIGGTGSDLMDGSGAQSNVFQFDSSLSGGSHTITDFSSGRDKLELVGYDTTAAFSNAHVLGGNTIISLDGGKTEITLTNFTTLTKADFIS